MKELDKDKVYKALLDLVVGAKSKEVVEEYVSGGDNLILKSRKISIKSLTPDISAIKLLLALSQDGYESMSEEELEEEKKKLLNLLIKNE